MPPLLCPLPSRGLSRGACGGQFREGSIVPGTLGVALTPSLGSRPRLCKGPEGWDGFRALRLGGWRLFWARVAATAAGGVAWAARGP